MGDPFGKDMDNLRKHMGGGEGRRAGAKEDKKPKFTYSELRVVFVCKNGRPKSADTVIRCPVHDLKRLEDLKARVGTLLFDGQAVLRVWMDDGVPVHAVNLLRDRDILFASTEAEAFYGDATPAPGPTPPAPSIPATPTTPEADVPPTDPRDPKPRPFYRPDTPQDGTSDVRSDTPASTLLDKYGGKEHLIYSDMLVSRPQALPLALRPLEEKEAAKPKEDPLDAAIKQKRKALTNASTATALLALLKQANPDGTAQDDLVFLATPETPGPAKPVGIVGDAAEAEDNEGPAVPALSRRQREQLQRLHRKKKAKKKQAKRRKLGEREARTGGSQSDTASGSDSDAPAGDPKAPGAARPPKPPAKAYVVLPTTTVGTLPVYNTQPAIAPVAGIKTLAPTAPAPQIVRPEQAAPLVAPRPPAAYVLAQQSVGPSRPPPSTTQTESDEDAPAPPVPRPGAAYVLQPHAVGPQRPLPNTPQSDSDDEVSAPPVPRPVAAYVLQPQAVGPQRPPPNAPQSDSDDETPSAPRPTDTVPPVGPPRPPPRAAGDSGSEDDDDPLGPKAPS